MSNEPRRRSEYLDRLDLPDLPPERPLNPATAPCGPLTKETLDHWEQFPRSSQPLPPRHAWCLIQEVRRLRPIVEAARAWRAAERAQAARRMVLEATTWHRTLSGRFSRAPEYARLTEAIDLAEDALRDAVEALGNEET